MLIYLKYFLFSPCNNNHQQQNATSWESKNIKKGNIFFWKTSLKKGVAAVAGQAVGHRGHMPFINKIYIFYSDLVRRMQLMIISG